MGARRTLRVNYLNTLLVWMLRRPLHSPDSFRRVPLISYYLMRSVDISHSAFLTWRQVCVNQRHLFKGLDNIICNSFTLKVKQHINLGRRSGMLWAWKPFNIASTSPSGYTQTHTQTDTHRHTDTHTHRHSQTHTHTYTHTD